MRVRFRLQQMLEVLRFYVNATNKLLSVQKIKYDGLFK